MKKQRAAITLVMFVVLFFLFSFTAKEAKAATNGTVTVSKLNVRSGPGIGYKKINSISNGQTYPVISSQSGWYRLKIGSIYGWVCGDYLKVSSTQQPPVNTTPPQTSDMGAIKVTADLLNVRQNATVSSNKIGSVKTGETYKYVDKSGVWYKIKYGPSYGWVHGNYVATVSDETTAPPQQPQRPEQPQQPQTPGQQPAEDDNGGISVGDTVVSKYNLMSIRSDKELGAPVIARTKKGISFTVLESVPGWLKIQYESQTGWIRTSYIEAGNQAQNKPNTPITDVTNEIGSLKIYKTDSKNCVAIPVTTSVSKNSSMTVLNPDISHSLTGDGTLTVNINNSVFRGAESSINAYNNELLSSINIMNIGSNTTSIRLNLKPGALYEVSSVPSKSLEDDEYRYLSTYIVVSLKKTVDSSSGQSKPVQRNSQGKAKGDYLIALDAGHGGTSSGAVSKGYEEKTLAFDITMKLNDILKAQGYDTYMTRDNDSYVSLSERADGANILKTDIFMSIHLNSYYSGSSNGIETLYNSQAAMPGTGLAQTIQNHLSSSLNRRDRGIVNRPDLAVLNSTNMPAVLAEIMFMSNTEELGLMVQNSVRQKSAQAIAEAVNEYFGFSN